MTRAARHAAALVVVLASAIGAARDGRAGETDAEDAKPHLVADLVSETTTIRPGGHSTLGIRLRIDPDWHVYWKNPGDSGEAPSVAWSLPAGARAGPIQWPAPTRIRVAGLGAFVYVGEIVLPVRVAWPEALPPGPLDVAADVTWLVCKEGCLTGEAHLVLHAVVDAAEAKPDPRFTALFGAARALLPRPVEPGVATATHGPDGYALRLARGGRWDDPAASLEFFPEEDVLANADLQPVSRDDAGVTMRLAVSKRPQTLPEDLRGVLVVGDGPNRTAFAVDTSQRALAPTGGERVSLWAALLLALAGGVILNLMPCVLPVLAPKVIGFVERAGEDRAHARRHGFAYGAGVVASFWALAALLLALKAGGEAVGWGFQLQEPRVVAAMSLLFVGMGLNLFGLFEVGTSFTGLAAHAGGAGYRGSFLGGALATVVATPCGAPFMGTAVARALSGTAVETIGILTALGVGLALPFVLLTAFPRAVMRLPKPGAWMETLKRALAFPLFATSVWLASVFVSQVGPEGLVPLGGAVVGTGLALWIYGTWGAVSRREAVRWIVGRGLAFVVLAASVAWVMSAAKVPPAAANATSEDTSPAAVPTPAPTSTSDGWEPYSAARLAAALAEGRPVLVDFTADWCLTCKANERAVLATDTVRDAVRKHDVVTLKADWTRKDAAITAALKALGQASVPVYVVHSPVAGRAPKVLPTLLTTGTVVDALAEAAAPGPAPSAK